MDIDRPYYTAMANSRQSERRRRQKGGLDAVASQRFWIALALARRLLIVREYGDAS